MAEESANRLGFSLRKEKEKPSHVKERDGVKLSPRESRILDFLRRQRRSERDGWTSATQIRKHVGEHEAKTVRKILDGLVDLKFVEWTAVRDGVEVYRYIPEPGEGFSNGLPSELMKVSLAPVFAKTDVSTLFEGPNVLLVVETPARSSKDKNPSEGKRDDMEAAAPSLPPEPHPLTKGKRVLFIVNRKDPENEERLRAVLGPSHLQWGAIENRDPRLVSSLCASIQNGSFDVVLAAVGFMDHATDGKLVEACDKASVRYVRVQKGRTGAVLRALDRIQSGASTPPQDGPTTASDVPVTQRDLRPQETLLPILRALLQISPDSPAHFKDVVPVALKEMGLGVECMGFRSDGRPNVYTPFLNGASVLVQTYGCLTVEGRDWYLTEQGKTAANSGELLARVIQLPLPTPSTPPPPPPVEVPVPETKFEPIEEDRSEDPPLKRGAKKGTTIVKWSGAELFRLEQLHDEGCPAIEIAAKLKAEFETDRTVKTIHQTYSNYFGATWLSKSLLGKEPKFPEGYREVKEAFLRGKVKVEKTVARVEEKIEHVEEKIHEKVSEAKEVVKEKAAEVVQKAAAVAVPIAMASAPPVPLPPAPPAPVVVAPVSKPTSLKVNGATSQVSGQIEVEILDPNGSYYPVTTQKTLGQIVVFLRTGTHSETMHAEIIGASGSVPMDVRRTLDEVLIFLIGG
jgi:hypothetical protein